MTQFKSGCISNCCAFFFKRRAQGYGFITDYLAEIFSRLRRRNYQIHVNARDGFAGITGRNQDAVRKVTASLLKLIFPHRTDQTLADDELERCLNLAVECRERVLAQLAVMAPGEFSTKGLTVKKLADSVGRTQP